MKYNSQNYQDLVLNKVIFPSKENGFFLDIGANDGITFSNSYFLEKERNWEGICVEPLPQTFKILSDNRKCILENCAVGVHTKNDTFLEITGYAEMLSGLKSNYNKKHLVRIDAEIKHHGGTKKEIDIRIMNVNELLAKYSVH